MNKQIQQKEALVTCSIGHEDIVHLKCFSSLKAEITRLQKLPEGIVLYMYHKALLNLRILLAEES